jgi:hypothetical protein
MKVTSKKIESPIEITISMTYEEAKQWYKNLSQTAGMGGLYKQTRILYEHLAYATNSPLSQSSFEAEDVK